MAKLKNTKNELKRQKDALKRFVRYLPTLMLKKQQLQLEIVKITYTMEELEKGIQAIDSEVEGWADVFSEDVDITEKVKVKHVATQDGNIAGIDIPVFENIEYEEEDYDLLTTPLWVDYGVDKIKEKMSKAIEHQILETQLELVKEELRITTQRVNLFEKIKIPETKENIRKIRIFLGDLQTAAVVTGKIAKAKIERKIRQKTAYDS